MTTVVCREAIDESRDVLNVAAILLESVRLTFVNCSDAGALFEDLPRCCSDGGLTGIMYYVVRV